MRINDDFTRPVIVHAARQDWIASPAAGVDRRMLFRIGDEKARATSIVRYAPGSAFPRHTHTGGEEFVVLDGVFQDEHGDYPAGSYIRNTPGTSHVPASKGGCTIFVRLWQFRSDDQAQTVRQPGEGQRVPPRAGAAAATLLFDDGREEVRFEDWQPDASVTVENSKGLELLLVSGGLRIGKETLEPQAWVRLPAGMALEAQASHDGARVWIKRGPLMHENVCAF
ncbi:cupin domain-containing protein [Bradyrhizobium sp.]|uniref:cupin domain-containing protein n=1 Tax=Bradyrhizobium sp. TaxID=376 RepID=UPI002D75CA72|nr:cupin domain-containing protein [Bradyrhizobium sp.]HZR71785.1 cupin domain-containing protein [Bradyrhizobium sp.]